MEIPKTKQENRITYIYKRWDEEAKRPLPITITSGENGVTEEHIIILNDFKHAAELRNRYEKENRDYDTENKKAKFNKDPNGSIGDPIENLGTRQTDPFFLIDHDVDKPDPLVNQLLTLMKKLTPQQIDLIYYLFGSQRQLSELAREENKSVTAIHNRKKKIIARLKKLFAEQGVL